LIKWGTSKKISGLKEDAASPIIGGLLGGSHFFPGPRQQYMYVADGGDEQVKILDRASGEVLSSFGRPGHQIGEFTHAHTLAVDSRGNVYVAETNWGRRVQKFEPVK
jgi:DNA-binding beta-propeller fold protein YncE